MSYLLSYCCFTMQVLEQVTPKFDLALCPTAVLNEDKNRTMDHVPSMCSHSWYYNNVYSLISSLLPVLQKLLKNWEKGK